MDRPNSDADAAMAGFVRAAEAAATTTGSLANRARLVAAGMVAEGGG
jgi:hypothetical protein